MTEFALQLQLFALYGGSEIILKKTLCFFAALCVTAATVALLSSCNGNNDPEQPEQSDTVRVTAPADSTAASTESPDYKPTQEIIDTLYNNVTLKDGRIYLFFGARVTLTVENFNRLILEDQLGFEPGTYTFVMDDKVLEALKQDDAYGGIGFGQEWIAHITASIKNVKTGEESEPEELVFTFNKSEEADAALNPESGFTTSDESHPESADSNE